MPKLLLWKEHPGDLLGETIEVLTHGRWSHFGFQRLNGKVHELYLPRVRDRDLLESEKPLIDVFSIRGITPEQEAKFEKAFDTCLAAGIEYSVTDLFRYMMNIPPPNDVASYCSRYGLYLCHIVLPFEMWPLVRVEGGDDASPVEMGHSPILIAEPPLT